MSLEAAILKTREKLGPATTLVSRELDAHAKKAKELQVLVHSAFEYFNGEWEPDDIDREKFRKMLQRADR